MGQRRSPFFWLSIPLLLLQLFVAGENACGQEEDELDQPKRDVYDLPTAVAIEGRNNKIDQSVALSVGYIPTDSFNRGFPLTFNYTYYFKPYFAWEVLNYSYNFNKETQLKQDFKDLGVAVENIGFGGVIDYPRYIILTGIVYTPLYGKSLLFNKSVVRSETSFYLGVGSLVFNQVGQTPTLAPGIQARYFTSNRSALRVYLREYFFNDTNLGLTAMTELGIGFETQFELLSRRATGEGE